MLVLLIIKDMQIKITQHIKCNRAVHIKCCMSSEQIATTCLGASQKTYTDEMIVEVCTER